MRDTYSLSSALLTRGDGGGATALASFPNQMASSITHPASSITHPHTHAHIEKGGQVRSLANLGSYINPASSNVYLDTVQLQHCQRIPLPFQMKEVHSTFQIGLPPLILAETKALVYLKDRCGSDVTLSGKVYATVEKLSPGMVPLGIVYAPRLQGYLPLLYRSLTEEISLW